MIDLASQYAVKFDYWENGRLAESFFLFSPDDEIKEKVKAEYENHGFTQEILHLVRQDETELSYIRADYKKHSIHAFRSITSHYEIFYKKTTFVPEGIIISDHLLNLLSYLPIQERNVCLAGVCDMFLFQHSYGKETYYQGVYRLGCGEELLYQNQELLVRQVQRLQLQKYDLGGRDGADVLEQSLREACAKIQKPESVNTLSGGIDSTLTHIIMGNPKSVSGSYEHEKFLCEKEYALCAAKLLYADHKVYDISLENYMEEMVRTVKHCGMPVYNMTAQIIHHILAEKVNTSYMMVSELAGAVYGLELRTPYTKELAGKYSFSDFNNYANQNSSIARKEDIDWISRIFGKEMVEAQLQKRNNYVLDRLEGFDTSDLGSDNYLQFGHLLYYFTNNGVSALEQTEMVFGKTVNALFSAKKVVEEFLSLPLHERYENEIYGEKPFAKRLLERLLPEYEVKKKKLGGSLPRTWMVTEGPMAGYFKTHDIPSFIDPSLRNIFLEPSWETSWCVKYLVMYSVWYENVMRCEVKKLPSKYQVSFESNTAE